jgi:hypothetical protein
MSVCRINVRAAKVDAGVVMSGYATRVGYRRPRVLLVCSVEHQLRGIEPEQCPIETIALGGSVYNLKAK